MHIPALLAFPLNAKLVTGGASMTVVGFVTLPLEMQLLGRRFALVRNALSLVAAVFPMFLGERNRAPEGDVGPEPGATLDGDQR